MTEDLPLTLDDYRSLAAFLEGQLTEPESLTPVEVDELRTRLVRIHLLLGDTERAAAHSTRLRHEDEAEAFDLTSAARSSAPDEPERPKTAMEQIEALLAKDPGDDELRALYLETARSEGGQVRAAGALARVAGSAKGNEGRERVWLDVGILYLEEGELPQARVAFLQAVLGGAGGAAALGAARRLLALQVEPSDPDVVGPALNVIVKADADPAARQDAAMRLLALHEIAPQKDGRVTDALEALIGSPKEDAAVSWLIALREPDPEGYSRLVSWLKQMAAWEPLSRVLEAEVEVVGADEQAERFAQLGQIRLVRCNDLDGALAAFRRCLTSDPTNEVGRGAVERLMTTGARRLVAAEILDDVYRRAPSDEGELRVLETRAELLPDATSRLVAFAAAADLAKEKVGDPRRSIRLCRHALETDPSSPDWLRRLDDLLADSEEPSDRLARYETALERATVPGSGLAPSTPDRRRDLRRTIAKIKSDALDDLAGATEVWRQMVADDPSDVEAIDALLDASDKIGDAGPTLAAVVQARRSLDGRQRHDVTVRTARALSRHGDRASALALCRELFDDPAVTPSVVQSIAEIAHDEDDSGLYRGALEVLVRVGDTDAKRHALEQLGDFHFEQLGDRRAAAESWRPAAALHGESPAERERARGLYERVLEALPDDRDAAKKLAEMYAEARDWTKLPAVLRVLMRTDPEKNGPVQLLLELERNAIEAGAAEEFSSLADDILGRIDPVRENVHALKRARAAVLSHDPSHQDQASKAYRELVEVFALEEDARAFEAFVDSKASSQDRHQDRRWLFAWRAERQGRPAQVLLDWARTEEEFGETGAAIAVYERLAKEDPGRRDALEALCRLRLHAGDFEGGLAALRSLRDAGSESERGPIILRMARVLLEDLGRPTEAAMALAPLVGAVPPVPAAHQWMQRVLADETERGPIIERLEQLANQSAPATSVGIFGFLVSARVETADLPEARRRWLQRIVDFSEDPAAALAAAVAGATEAPDSLPLWESAERIARQTGQPDTVSRAYHGVLVGPDSLDPELAEMLARRMVTFESECGSESSRLVEALVKTLDRSPGARWAIDRVKLVLGSQARWDELFRLYDRAIDAAPDDGQRASLLDEAAFAAKDLAGRPDRAIVYLEAIHGLRPDDPVVDAALERLYERQGQTGALIELLEARLKHASGFKHRELLHRISSLWLDIGSRDQAMDIVEQMLRDSSSVTDVVTLLERVAAQSTGLDDASLSSVEAPATSQKRAIAILKEYYESAGRAEDVVRMAERQLALADDAEQRARCVRDLVNLRIAAAAQNTEAQVFAQVVPRVEADIAGDPLLAKIALEALLQQAVAAWKRPPSPAYGDAEDGAWTTVHLLKGLLVENGQAAAALSLLYRSSRLPFERARRREMLREAALVCAERLDDRVRAIRVFRELFEEDGGDDAASRSLERYADLLEQAGDLPRLAGLWETQSAIHAKADRAGEQRTCWERAAVLWERQGDLEKALADYGQASALGSQTAFESLARVHTSRAEWADAVGALEWLVAHSSAEVRGLRALQLAEAYVELDDRDRARTCLENALAAGVEAQRADDVPERLIALYRQDAKWRPLARLLAAEAKRIELSERRLALLQEAADLHRRKLDEPAEAAALLELAVSWAQKDATLRPLLADVLEILEQWDKIVLVLRDQIALYRDQRSKSRALTHHRVARALTRAGRSEQALAELQTAIEMHPSHPVILYDLGGSALSAGQLDVAESTYRALLLALHHSMEDAEDAGAPSALRAPDRAEVFVELSEIASRKGDSARAADLIDSAVQAALESGQDPKRFEAPLLQRGRYELLARAIEARVDRAASLEGRAVALGDLAEIWAERLGRSAELGARITNHVGRIGRELEHEGLTDAAAWAALSSVQRWFGDESASLAIVQRRLTLLEGAIGSLPAGADRNRIRAELARIYLQDPARTAAAITLLGSVLDDDPTDRVSADLLADALEREGRFDELVVALERRLRPTPSNEDAARYTELSWRLGRALESAGRPREALRVYESLVDRAPDDRTIVSELAGRLEALGSKRLADCLERLLASGGGAGAALAERLLELRDRSGDTSGARRALELGFAVDPGNASFLPRLVDEHQKAGRPRETLRVLDAALAGKETPDPKLLSLRAGARESLGDDDGALFDLESASVADDRHIEALLELQERILARQTAKAEERPLPATADAYAIRVVDVLIQADRLETVRRELERLLARTPTHPDGLERMASLACAEGKWDDAVETYRKLWPVVKDGDRETLLRVVLALAAASERAGHAETARESLELAMKKAPDSREVMQRLERVCEVTGDFARLAHLVLSEAERPENAAERTRLLVRGGSMLLENAGEASQALEVADRARAADVDSLDAVLLAARAQLALGRAREALAVLAEAAARNRGKRSPVIARLHLESAKAHLAIDEIVEAFDALKAGFSMDWRNGEIAMLLGLVAIDLDEEKIAERALSGLTAMPARRGASTEGVDPAAQATAFYQLAKMAHAKGDRGKARRLANKAVGVDAAHAEAVALLAHLEPAGSAAKAPRTVAR